MDGLRERVADIDGIKLRYFDGGEGPALLLLHGWPTHAGLWRNVAPALTAQRRVIVLDLPGFGASDKPTDASYSFRFFDRLLDGFLASLGIDKIGLVVHDLGGPIGLHWAVGRPERLTEIALLNTLVFPEFSRPVKIFVALCKTAGVRRLLTTQFALRKTIELGVHRSRRTAEVTDRYLAPYHTRGARLALAKAGCSLHPSGFATIAKGLASLDVPRTIIYGTHDKILADVGETMARVQAAWPDARTVTLDAGHFLQEDAPEQVVEHLLTWLARAKAA